MTSDPDLTDAIHRIRERALRQAMAMVNRLQPDEKQASAWRNYRPKAEGSM